MKTLPVLSLRLAVSTLAVLPSLALYAQPPVDRDGDGHSDLWQLHYGISSANGGADSDGDGASDSSEEQAGTNPWAADSAFSLGGFELRRDPRGAESARFLWQGLGGKHYQFQFSDDLAPGNWRNLGLPVQPEISGLLTAELGIPGDAGRGFFRARVADVDADGDGLTAFEEKLIGTSDLTAFSGGTAGPPDTLVAAAWADAHDPGYSAGPLQANLREVDVAFIRETGSAAGGGADLVTVAGTGAWHCLTSWRAAAGANPVPLFTAPPLQGHHARVHLLEPAKFAAQPLFVTARISADDAFWISTRSLAANGSFLHHGTAQWKPNLLIHAKECDVTHRAVFSRTAGLTHYHAVAALVQWNPVSQSRNLRVLCWRVDAATGALSLLKDNFVSGPAPGADARLRITHLASDEYQMVYRNESGVQVHLALSVDDSGAATAWPAAEKTVDIRGQGEVATSVSDDAAAGLTGSGYLTANRTAGGELRLSVWDRRTETGTLKPHLIANDQTDSAPQVPGIGQPVPTLTDSFDGVEDPGELFSQAMAMGDFNGDGTRDAAFGSPLRDAGGVVDSGGVFVMHGAWDGMKSEGYTQYWRQGADGLGGDNAPGDNFGAALASGDFNGDGFADLAVGTPGEDFAGGGVHVLYGTVFGLTAANDTVFSANMLIPGIITGQPGIGTALVAGDFNGDGRDDLAIGAPGEFNAGLPGSGAVHVLWGSGSGLTLTGKVRLAQPTTFIGAGPEYAGSGDAFGMSLAAGDFNGDGKSDLVVGVPQEDVGTGSNAGAVNVYYGAPAGFTGGGLLSRAGFDGGSDIQGTPGDADAFGWSLATGDFDNDNRDDLAIGVPGDSVAGAQTGALHVIYGSAGGLAAAGNQMFRQAGSLAPASSLPSPAAAGEDLGWSLAAGDGNGDGFTDLYVSAPGEDLLPNSIDGGAFFIIPGGGSGLSAASATMLRPGGAGPDGAVSLTPQPNDKFAFSLACGDFNGDGKCDVMAGVPRRDKDANNLNTGAVQFFRGAQTGMVSTATDFTWTPRRRETVRGIVADLAREDFSGTGAGKLYSLNEGLPEVHMASSTKTMTLLLAVEAIEDGKVSLNDEVTVSTLAGTTGGSTLPLYNAGGNPIPDGNGNNQPFIQPGDKMPLRLLIAGMMGRSCNRCSVAIGEHVAKKVTGDPKDFVILMNARAAQLNMTTSTFGHPAGGWVTKLQDGINLQLEGIRHPLFVEFASFGYWGDEPGEVLGGKDLNGNPKVNGPFQQMDSIGSYPGRLTWKGGNGGLWFNDTQADGVPERPEAAWCTESRVTTARRAGRTLCAVLQQTDDGTAQSQNLMDYGYRKIFTPDLRGTREFPASGGIIGPEGPVRVKNFAVSGWTGHGITAVIDDHEELRLNIWVLNVGASQITPDGSATRTYNLLAGATYEPSALVSLSEVPSENSLTDLFTANLIGDRLELRAWRIDQK